jgi:hypothetical protein
MVSEKKGKKFLFKAPRHWTKFGLLLAILSFLKKEKRKKKVSAQVSRRLHKVLNLLLAISSEKKKGYKNWQEEYSKQQES